MKIYFIKSLLFSLLISGFAIAQSSPDYNGGFKVKFNESGSKYLRAITWVQGQVNTNFDAEDGDEKTSMQLRRARVLLIGQITPKFMILTHFGVNSLNASSMTPTGKGDGSQIFMHGAWGTYNFSKQFSLGAGLHYYNGISRLNNQSTLNMLTLSNNRASWATLGLSDQFARHVGIFAKGTIHKLQYQLAFNEVIENGLDTRTPTSGGSAVYGGRRLLDANKASKNYAGYFQYNFLDVESDFLPYKVGTYLGAKKIFNIGAGFFINPNGSVYQDDNGNLIGDNVSIYAVDAFLDMPLSEKGDALTAYAVYQKNDYGKDYLYNPYGTGNMVYGHLGYLIPGKPEQIRFQPYASFGSSSFDASDDNKNRLGVGVNSYISGNNCKLTLEYANEKFGDTQQNLLNIQAMIWL